MPQLLKTHPLTVLLGVIAILFGLVTLWEGGAVVFNLGDARLVHPHFVPFVLYISWISGLLYVAAGVGMLLRKAWSAKLASAIAILMLLTFAALGIHIATGGAYDAITLKAITVRSLLWVGIATWLWKQISAQSEVAG